MRARLSPSCLPRLQGLRLPALLLASLGVAFAALSATSWLSPADLTVTPDGSRLLVACATEPGIRSLDARTLATLTTTPLPGVPSGLALTPDGRHLLVACRGTTPKLCVLDAATGQLARSFEASPTTTAPVPAPDSRSVWVCCRHLNRVEALDLADGRCLQRISTPREPISAALTPDGRHLIVAHHLPDGPADHSPVSATLTVIDTAGGKVERTLQLPNGATELRQIRSSPDGRLAAVTHLLARYQAPTTQLDRGWMNNNALTLVDLQTLSVRATILLDDVDRGAANPWAVAWTPDSRSLCISHAGTHELSLLDVPALLERLARRKSALWPEDDFTVLHGLRRRIPLQGRGPRALVHTSAGWIVAGYFTDTLEVVPHNSPATPPSTVVHLGLSSPASPARLGEMLFNDASICFQGWQSCASCHGEEARVDGLNWDLLNDGLGNPKNTKSLLWAHRTPPAMSLGVRDTAPMAVRAGIRGILFSTQPESVALAIDTWLQSLQPAPSPHLVRGKLSPAARRGQSLFRSARTGCASCHPHGLFTDQKTYDVGTAGPTDAPGQAFDTPTLVELWRTAPYLHDGSAASVREVLSSRNAGGRHGHTSHLADTELDDLVHYLLSL